MKWKRRDTEVKVRSGKYEDETCRRYGMLVERSEKLIDTDVGDIAVKIISNIEWWISNNESTDWISNEVKKGGIPTLKYTSVFLVFSSDILTLCYKQWQQNRLLLWFKIGLGYSDVSISIDSNTTKSMKAIFIIEEKIPGPNFRTRFSKNYVNQSSMWPY